jgi:drug/metabolite transporter (DMT)-like permease
MFFLAAASAVAGVVLMAGNGDLHPPSLGDLLVLCAAVARAVHVTSIHKLTNRRSLDSLHLTTVQLATCAVVFMAASPFYGTAVADYLAQWVQSQIVLFLYLVLVCTVFAFFVQTWAVRRTSPTRVSLLLGTEPVWAAIIGIAIAHDSFGPIGYLGIALVLVGTATGRAIEARDAPLNDVTIDGSRPASRAPSGR